MIKCNLAVLMAERGLNIQDVADRTGLSRTTISALYNNNGKGIQFDTMDALCELLKVSPGDLFTYIFLRHEIIWGKTENISIDEHWRTTPIEPVGDIEICEYDINCDITLKAKINYETSFYDSWFTLNVKYSTNAEGELTYIRYSYSEPNGFDAFLKNLQYMAKEKILEEIENALIEATGDFEEIKAIGSLTIDCKI